MLRHATLVVCVFSLVLASVGVASATTYTFTTLAPVSPDTQSFDFAINLVGGAFKAAGASGGTATNLNSPGKAAIWDGTGAGTSIHGDITTESPTGTRVFSMDGNGDVAGYDTSTNVWKHAFYLASGGSTATILPVLNSGDAYVFAYGLNNSNQVVGLDGVSSATVNRAVVWSQTAGVWGTPVALPSLTTGASSWAYAINNTMTNGYGTVAGYSYDAAGVAQGHEDATVWSYNGYELGGHRQDPEPW